MTILNRRRGVYEVTHMLDGEVVWTSPAISADTETDARIEAHAMRSDFNSDWEMIGDAPKGHGECVRMVRSPNA